MHFLSYLFISVSIFYSSLYAIPSFMEGQGHLASFTFRSKILKNTREMWVYTPANYLKNKSQKPYPLLIVFDGQAYVSELIPTPDMLDTLIAQGKIPPVVAVFISSIDQPSRNRELPCYSPFVESLTKEFLPWIRSHYNVTSDPKRIALAGSSYGGLAAAYTAWCHPELFGNVISQSGAFWWKPPYCRQTNWLVHHYSQSPRQPIRFYMDVGDQENESNMLNINRSMRDLLQQKGYTVHYTEFHGGHEYDCWKKAFPGALVAILSAFN